MTRASADGVTFSVIIPLHNKAAWVRRAVASVLDQAGPACQVIVVDDGSTDSPAAALAPFRHRIDFLRQMNAGPSAARNAGAARARGRWLVFLDADDVLLPGALASHLAAFDKCPGADLSIASQRRALDGGAFHLDVAARLTPAGTGSDPVVLDGFRMDCVRGVHIGAFCIGRDLFEQSGGFDRRLRCWERLDLSIRALLAARRVVVSRATVLRAYETPGSQFVRTSRDPAFLLRLAANLIRHLPRVPEAERDAYCRQVAGFIYELWNVGATRQYKALAGRIRRMDGWRHPSRRALALAALPLPVLREISKLRSLRNRLAAGRRSTPAVATRLAGR